MKKRYPISILMLGIVSGLFAQQMNGNLPTGIPVQPETGASSPSTLVVNDTLKPPSFSLPCSNTRYYYVWDYNNKIDTGFVFGNSIYNETESAQKYKGVSGTVSKVLVRIGHKAGTTGSTTAKIYSIDGTKGCPLTVLGISPVVTTGSVITNGYTVYTFSTPVSVAGGFFASIVNPTTTGDSIAIVCTQLGCPPSPSDSLSWSLYPGTTVKWWSTIRNLGANFNADLIILPIGTVTGIQEYGNGSLSLLGAYPNPTQDQTTIRFNLKNTSLVSIDVFDLSGRIISQSTETFGAGNHEYKIEQGNLSSGNYYYTVTSNDAKLTSEFSVVK